MLKPRRSSNAFVRGGLEIEINMSLRCLAWAAGKLMILASFYWDEDDERRTVFGDWKWWGLRWMSGGNWMRNMEFRVKVKTRGINLEVVFISMIFKAMGLD